MKSKEPKEYTIKGRYLECPVCKNHLFFARETLMNTPGMTLMGIEWANKSAQNFVCTECGYVMWFLTD